MRDSVGRAHREILRVTQCYGNYRVCVCVSIQTKKNTWGPFEDSVFLADDQVFLASARDFRTLAPTV